jgi:hypothetical protein
MKTTTLLLVAMLLCSCASHQQVEWSTANKIALGAAVGGSVLDVHSTNSALNRGCVEANPLLGENPSVGSLILLKAVGIGLIYVISEYLVKPKDRQLVRNVGYGAIGLVGVGAAVHNYSINCE